LPEPQRDLLNLLVFSGLHIWPNLTTASELDRSCGLREVISKVQRYNRTMIPSTQYIC